jgi:acyl-coenzyme A thioesterase PaaI-like protein
MAERDTERWREHGNARPLSRLLGIRAEESGEGYTLYRVVPSDGNSDGLDGSEPGTGVSTFAIVTAVDIALVQAVSTTIDSARETMNGTAELNVTFVAQPRGAVTIRSDVVHRDQRLRVALVDVVDEDGRRVAYCRSTYSVRPGAEQPATERPSGGS